MTRLIAMVAGMLVWAAHFLTVYAGHAVACERGWRLGPGFILLATLAGAGVVAWIAIAAGRRGAMPDGGTRPFLAWMTLWLGVVGLTGMILAGGLGLLLQGCR